MITERAARNIASNWHGGQSSAMYAFASTGTIIPGLKKEIAAELQTERDNGNPELIAELESLLTYVARQLTNLA